MSQKSACDFELLLFDEAMSLSQYKNIRIPQNLYSPFSITPSALYLFFKQLYEKNNPVKVPVKVNETIPKIIHHIWLGSNLPEVFEQYVISWRIHHPDWEHIFWDDAKIAQLQMYNQKLYDTAINYGQKSDIARYEILYQFGGLYVDTDFECLQSFDELHQRYDLYAGLLPLDTGLLQIGNGLIGACKAHPFLLHIIENMHTCQNERSISSQTGPIYFTHKFYQYNNQQTVTLDVALPAAYFYPLGSTEVSLKNNLFLQPYAIHHWARSWCDKKSRRPWFMGL